MRKFSKNEQDIIKRIVAIANESLSYVLINAYGDIFYQRKVEYAPNTTNLKYYRNIDVVSLDEILSVEKEIIETSVLIDYLVNNRYIYIIDESEEDNLPTIGGFDKQNLNPISKPISKEIAHVLTYSLRNRIFITQDLVELVNNKFMTIEEQSLNEAKIQTTNARKTIKLSIWAVVFSSLSIVVAVSMPIYYTSTIKVDKSQIVEIKNEENLRNKKVIDQLNSVNLKMDSILVVNRKHANKEKK